MMFHTRRFGGARYIGRSSMVGPRWLRREGKYVAYIAVRSVPYNLPENFVQSIMQRFEYSGASVSVYRVSRTDALSRLDRAATRYGAELAYRLESGKQTASLADLHSRITELRDAVAADCAYLIDAAIVFSVTGMSVEETEVRIKSIESELKTNGIGVHSGRYIQRKLARMFDTDVPPVFPFIVSLTERSLPALMPFTQTPLIQPGGTLLGTDTADGSPVILNRFAGTNFNTIIMGKSGSGKSYFAKLMILREAAKHRSSYYILDPLGEFMQTALFLGGVHRSIGSEGLGAGSVIVSHSAAIVSNAVELVCRAVQLNAQESATVRNLFYGQATMKPGDTVAQTFSAVYASLVQSGATDISRRLNRALSGDLSFILSGEVPKPSVARVTVYDYSLIDSGLKSAVAQFLLETVFELCKYADGTKTLVIDEAWRFSDDERLRAALSRTMRHSRHYNLAIMLLTQNISDVTSGAFTNGILNNTDSCFIFRHEDGAATLPEDYQIAPEERDFVNSFTPREARKSRCIMVAAGRKVKLEIESSIGEFSLCNSEALGACSVFQFICLLAGETLDKIDCMLAEAF
ncbi:MAG: DUF87 domain-containing protein [Thermoplasmata archaeon]|nr:DUF87 domain-containing protein [Candidatus Sysuiplasma acidicola]